MIFDDCWNPNPIIGSQPAPKPGIHNSGWVQSPSLDVVNRGASAWGRLEQYVGDIIGSFADDERILLWDLYNEPGNSGNGENSVPLVKSVFEWARAADPGQPLSVGIWFDNKELNEFQLAVSDVITFHNYSPADHLERQIAELKTHVRPLVCTEWMARTCGSLGSTHLPIFSQEKVGCLNWGLVAGKTNTIYQWEVLQDFLNPVTSFTDPDTPEPRSGSMTFSARMERLTIKQKSNYSKSTPGCKALSSFRVPYSQFLMNGKIQFDCVHPCTGDSFHTPAE
ncbi:MAG: cellulase family glycosylhydrolase [Anaerolineales bacterium]